MSTASELARFERGGSQILVDRNNSPGIVPQAPTRRAGDRSDKARNDPRRNQPGGGVVPLPGVGDATFQRRRTDSSTPPVGGGNLRNDTSLVGTGVGGKPTIRPDANVPGDRVADNGAGGGRTPLPVGPGGAPVRPGGTPSVEAQPKQLPGGVTPIDLPPPIQTGDILPGQAGDPNAPPTPGQPAQDPNAIGLENLGGLLERLLGSPDVFGNEQILQLRESLARERGRERRDVGSAINVDAARRGVLQSSIPVTERIGLEDRLAGRAEDADVQLLNLAAQSRSQNLNQQIQNAFGFLNIGQQGDVGLGQLGGLAEQLGIQGAPNQGQGIQALLGLAGGQAGGINPQLLQQLGTLFGGGGGGGGTGGLDINALIQQLLSGGSGPVTGDPTPIPQTDLALGRPA